VRGRGASVACIFALVASCGTGVPAVPGAPSATPVPGDLVAPASDAGPEGAAPDATPDVAADAGGPDAPGDAVSPRCAPAPLATTLTGLVAAILARMKAIGGATSGAFQIPSASVRDAFAKDVIAALEGDDAASCRLPASYRIVTVSGGSLVRRVVAELDATGAPAPVLFWGTYASQPAPARPLVMEAPHPIFDSNTADEAADIFVRANARWLLVSGAHRCANVDPSPCSGTTTACSAAAAPYRISDVAHAVVAPFHAVHVALSARDPALVFAQLHGNSASCPDALVSTAATPSAWPASGFVRAFADALSPLGPTVGRCGAGYPVSGCDLCGGGNVQARASAGSADACTIAAGDSGRFLHLEQRLSLRTPGAPPGWDPVLAALVAAVP
jgi:hypothetical protein